MVIDRARLCLHTDNLTKNQGGIVVAATSGVRLSVVDLGIKSSMLQLQGRHIVFGASWFFTVTIYQPGSVTISATFFIEMSDLPDYLIKPVLLTGYVNIWLE